MIISILISSGDGHSRTLADSESNPNHKCRIQNFGGLQNERNAMLQNHQQVYFKKMRKIH